MAHKIIVKTQSQAMLDRNPLFKKLNIREGQYLQVNFKEETFVVLDEDVEKVVTDSRTKNHVTITQEMMNVHNVSFKPLPMAPIKAKTNCKLNLRAYYIPSEDRVEFETYKINAPQEKADGLKQYLNNYGDKKLLFDLIKERYNGLYFKDVTITYPILKTLKRLDSKIFTSFVKSINSFITNNHK